MKRKFIATNTRPDPTSRLVLNAITHFQVYVQNVFALTTRSEFIHRTKQQLICKRKFRVPKERAEQVKQYIILYVVDIDFYCDT